MRSKWFELKPTAVALRKNGLSINAIEEELGIPRSTLSGWFKDVLMDDTHIARLQKNKEDAWARARVNAAIWHKAQKAARLVEADNSAQRVLDSLTINDDLIDLAFAMLYLGEGTKSRGTSIASSDPMILRFILISLERVYNLDRATIRCELHLRMDQDEDTMKQYWSEQLNIPIEQFKYVAFDKRSEGRTTYEHYKGVCLLQCGNIAIQRKLISLYNLFCEKVSSLENLGA
jgi:hypothetical protein